MIGIYKITNLINGKIYIGQSVDIKRRFSEHQSKGISSRIPLDRDIQKYKKENFLFEVIECCSIEELNAKETYWILYYNSNVNNYNFSLGGDFNSRGENNGRAILREEDVIIIRRAYMEHKRRRDVYKLFEDKISFNSFSRIWDGTSWTHIMPEVFTEENKLFYSRKATNGELSMTSSFTNEEVIFLRNQYVLKSAKELYKDYSNRCSYQSFQQILWGRTYKELPIYKKKEKKWINK